MSSVISDKNFFKSSCKKTLSDFGVSCSSIVTYSTTTLVPLILSLWLKWEELAVSGWRVAWEPFLYGLCGMTLTFVVHFLWNLWLAPYRAMEERLSEIEENKGSGSASLQPEPTKLTDFSGYKHHDNIQLYEAACLWVGLAPHHPLKDPKADVKLSLLKSAIRGRKLSSNWERFSLKDKYEGVTDRSPSDHQPVSMIALRKYADSIDDVPTFLKQVSTEEDKEQSGKTTS